MRIVLKSDAVVDVEQNVIRRMFIEHLLAKAPLTARERKVVRLWVGLDDKAETLEEIGQRFAVTRERIRQIREKAIRKLKKYAASPLQQTSVREP